MIKCEMDSKPVKNTSPSNFLHSNFTISNPMPLFAPVTIATFLLLEAILSFYSFSPIFSYLESLLRVYKDYFWFLVF